MPCIPKLNGAFAAGVGSRGRQSIFKAETLYKRVLFQKAGRTRITIIDCRGARPRGPTPRHIRKENLMLNNNVLQTVGSTSLVRLNSLARGCAAEVWVKLENRNPGGSVKDRIAVHMVEKALWRGALKPGGTLVEPTSGNTGIGLAMVAAVKGLHCILTMPESMSLERRALMAAQGAELVLTPAAAGMAGAVEKAERLAAEKGAFIPNQFSNPDVVEIHYLTTGPEILRDLEGRVDVLVAGVGTGGTVTGAGRYLREHLPGLRICAVEPADSPLLTKGKAGPHAIQGIGPNFIPAILDRTLLDHVIDVETKDAMATARRLFKEEGINAGISSGANVWAALQEAGRPGMEGKRVVTVICDTGERYLSTALFERPEAGYI